LSAPHHEPSRADFRPPDQPPARRMRRNAGLALLLIALGLFAWRSLYVLDDTELGWLSGGIRGTGVAVVRPGVHLKWPWQSVSRFSRQVRWQEIGPTERSTRVGGPIILTATVCWRIAPEGLAHRVQLSLDDDALRAQIANILSEGLDREVAQHPLAQFLGDDAATSLPADLCLGESVRAGRAPWLLERFGLELMEVSVTRVALPAAVQAHRQQEKAARCQAEAERIALAATEQNAEQRAKAEKDAELLKTKAQADAASTRAEGRARADQLLARARRPELASLLKVIEVYRASMDKDSTLVLEGGREFFRLIDSASAAEPAPAAQSRPALPAAR